ncbi:hypothetical protein [Ferruginibacter sp.]|uniref:hypothetical protein n=1 Tax=Ferruginibacter sp. TaxID=1940288 RepID=UPI002658EE82|nr:hypothetical protein [Ferruginibacter sp.]
MATKELNISPVGRVEGDLDVNVYMENGVVTRANTQASMFRGFEIILLPWLVHPIIENTFRPWSVPMVGVSPTTI